MKGVRQLQVWLMALLFALSANAFAISLQEAMASLSSAKEQGLVGEQPDGYLGVVNNSGNAQEIVSLINEARRAEYKKMAENNGISIKDVEALAGQKAIDRTQSGHYVFAGGRWVQK